MCGEGPYVFECRVHEVWFKTKVSVRSWQIFEMPGIAYHQQGREVHDENVCFFLMGNYFLAGPTNNCTRATYNVFLLASFLFAIIHRRRWYLYANYNKSEYIPRGHHPQKIIICVFNHPPKNTSSVCNHPRKNIFCFQTTTKVNTPPQPSRTSPFCYILVTHRRTSSVFGILHRKTFLFATKVNTPPTAPNPPLLLHVHHPPENIICVCNRPPKNIICVWNHPPKNAICVCNHPPKNIIFVCKQQRRWIPLPTPPSKQKHHPAKIFSENSNRAGPLIARATYNYAGAASLALPTPAAGLQFASLPNFGAALQCAKPLPVCVVTYLRWENVRATVKREWGITREHHLLHTNPLELTFTLYTWWKCFRATGRLVWRPLSKIATLS